MYRPPIGISIHRQIRIVKAPTTAWTFEDGCRAHPPHARTHGILFLDWSSPAALPGLFHSNNKTFDRLFFDVATIAAHLKLGSFAAFLRFLHVHTKQKKVYAKTIYIPSYVFKILANSSEINDIVKQYLELIEEDIKPFSKHPLHRNDVTFNKYEIKV